MIELMLKYFLFLTGFSSRMHARRAAVFALTLLLILTLMTATQADQEVDIVTNAGGSLEQMAQSAESEVQSHRTELTNLNGQLQELEAAQKKLQAQIKNYDTQNTAHGQLLLMNRVRTEDLENAARENRLAFKALSETVERFQRRLDSQSIDFEKNLERIELTKQQILDIRQSDLPGPRKRQLVEPMQQLFYTLEDKKRVEERILKIYDDLLDQAKSALAAKTEIGNRLTAALEKLKKTTITQRMNPYGDLSTGVMLEDLRDLKDRILSAFKFDFWKKLLGPDPNGWTDLVDVFSGSAGSDFCASGPCEALSQSN